MTIVSTSITVNNDTLNVFVDSSSSVFNGPKGVVVGINVVSAGHVGQGGVVGKFFGHLVSLAILAVSECFSE